MIELVNKGERVFISMGCGHAVYIEKTLREAIQQHPETRRMVYYITGLIPGKAVNA